jgi:hypothetical protein
VRRSAPANFGAPLPSFWDCEGFETDNLARQSAGMRRAATLPHGSINVRRNDDAEIEEDNHRSAVSGRSERDCFASLAMTADVVIARSAQRDEAISATRVGLARQAPA